MATNERDNAARRAAFAAWESYREMFEQTVAATTGVQPDKISLTRNPLTSVMFADGYLQGLAAAQERVTALEAGLREADDELTRIIHGTWIALNSVDTLLWWVERIQKQVRAALRGAGEGQGDG